MLITLREIAFDRFVFRNPPVLFAGDVARGYVHEIRVQQLDEFDEMLRSVYVRLERFVHRWIEVDNAGEVHDDIDFPTEPLDLFGGDAAQRGIHIAFDDLYLPTDFMFAAGAF